MVSCNLNLEIEASWTTMSVFRSALAPFGSQNLARIISACFECDKNMKEEEA